MKDSRTKVFTLGDSSKLEIKEAIKTVYDALVEKKYDPLRQISGYIITEDPAYITTHKDARNIIQRFSRYDILEELIKSYVGVKNDGSDT